VLVNEAFVSSTVFISLSLLVNVILTALIVSQLIYRQRHFRNARGEEHGYSRINIMTMCVESSALVVIFSCTYTALSFAQRQPVFPHICVGGLERHDV